MPEPPAMEALATRRITLGAIRVLHSLGISVIDEFPLGNGRRADISGLDRSGNITIVEVKSSPADFRSDRKWPQYLDYCDRFFFAVDPEFPLTLLDEPSSLPDQTGIIVADQFGGDVLREAPCARSSRRGGAVRPCVLPGWPRTAWAVP